MALHAPAMLATATPLQWAPLVQQHQSQMLDTLLPTQEHTAL
jgi:hypothetical protein